jgi:hypothetical protein
MPLLNFLLDPEPLKRAGALELLRAFSADLLPGVQQARSELMSGADPFTIGCRLDGSLRREFEKQEQQLATLRQQLATVTTDLVEERRLTLALRTDQTHQLAYTAEDRITAERQRAEQAQQNAANWQAQQRHSAEVIRQLELKIAALNRIVAQQELELLDDSVTDADHTVLADQTN